jgi:hypothetical protein
VLAGLRASVEQVYVTAKQDLTLDVDRGATGLEAALVYDRDLWKATTIQGWGRQLVAIAEAVVANPALTLASLDQSLRQAEQDRDRARRSLFERERARGLERLRQRYASEERAPG